MRMPAMLHRMLPSPSLPPSFLPPSQPLPTKVIKALIADLQTEVMVEAVANRSSGTIRFASFQLLVGIL